MRDDSNMAHVPISHTHKIKVLAVVEFETTTIAHTETEAEAIAADYLEQDLDDTLGDLGECLANTDKAVCKYLRVLAVELLSAEVNNGI